MTRARTGYASVLAIALMLGGAASGQQQKALFAETLMGQAQHQEEVEGNIEAAIASYQKVAADPQASRSLAARALLRVGELYEKLGHAEARKAYERVTREYADQAEIVAHARTRLTALGASGAPPDTRVVAQQIWVGDEVDPRGRPAVDGRHLIFVDWRATNSGNLAIRNLTTGENRRLTHFTAADGYAYEPVASPDGKQIAYLFYGEGRTSIRTIGIDGSGGRVLMEEKGAGAYYPYWSPDGRRLAVSLVDFAGDRTWRIVLVDVPRGSVTRLKSTGWREPELGGFSPDGRFLLYAVHKASSATDSGIFAVAVDGSGRESVLVKGTANDTAPVWTPDGQAVVFLTDRSGTQDLWSVRVSAGEARGEPTLVRANMGAIFNLGFTRDGSFFYGTANRQQDVYVADMDPDTLQFVTPPRRLSERFIGSNLGPAWSPDGRSIAFVRGADRRARSIVVQSVADGTERTLPVRLVDGYFVGAFAPTWMPDSRSLLLPDADWATQRLTIRRIDVDSGRERVVLQDDLSTVWPLMRVSPDGRSLYFTRRAKPTPELNVLRLVKRDFESGAEVELYRAESQGVGLFGLTLSPAGDRLAFSANVGLRDDRHVIVVPTTGGSARILHRGDYSHPYPAAGVWTRDGKYILAVAEETKSLHRVWAFPADGGEPRKLDIVLASIGRLDLSPDGRQVVFTGGQMKAEIWTVKNLIPDARLNTRSAR